MRRSRQPVEDFEGGQRGAGAGTICYGFKGGIGSASRLVEVEGKKYTIGVLVQSNFGATRCLTINGVPVGREILRETEGQELPSPSDTLRSHVKKALFHGKSRRIAVPL